MANFNKRFRYPGSQPFSRQDQSLFFGRDTDIEELIKYIQVEKLVILYGKSGLGKTSLLEAGVLPRLESSGQFFALSIRIGSYRKHDNRSPLQIFHEKTPLMTALAQEEPFLSQLEAKNPSLWQTFQSLRLFWHKEQKLPLNKFPEIDQQEEFDRIPLSNYNSKQTILLIFDQFEELFTYPDAQVDEFAGQLADLLNRRVPRRLRQKLNNRLEDDPQFLTAENTAILDLLEEPLKVKIVLSIRSDRYSLLNRMAKQIPDIMRNFYELKALNRKQAETAILEPAKLQGTDFWLNEPFDYTEDTLQTILNYLSDSEKKEIESFQLQIFCQYIESKLIQQNPQE